MALGPEYLQVEKPLIDQLKGMGWLHRAGAPPEAFEPTDPAASGRESFSEVFVTQQLRDAIYRLNLDPDGNPWLTGDRLSQAVSALTRIGSTSLLEANQQATELLLKGTTVAGRPGWDNGREQWIKYIDWDNPLNNDFTVISQFKVSIPGAGGKSIIPDVVLFVNGIPLALVECKKPGGHEAISQAIKQHQRYMDSRGAQTPEGNPKLFHTMQLLVATSGEYARLGSITSGPEHYAIWRDPYPMDLDELAQRLKKRSKSAVTQQDILAGVVLEPIRLLDIVRNFVTFMQTDEGHTVKVVPRYQQYRAVCKAIHGLRTGKTRQEDGLQDRRGGVVWHTQGSGKSLTMVFLVRKLRNTPGLADTKVVIVTDRKQLQDQLSKTMNLTGEHIDEAKKVSQAKTKLRRHGAGVLFVMIQKQQDVQARKQHADDLADSPRTPSLGELNTDESILVLIDEAHRSHSSTLHKNLLKALPNCARIGFTGTPIIRRAKKTTLEIFGNDTYIDVYKLTDAEQDGAVVPVLYSGQFVKGAVHDGRDMDEFFEDMFAELSDDDRQKLQQRYATKGDVMESKELVAAKARSMLRHYVAAILPNGFKAQLVAYSRRAAIRYRDALVHARDELVTEIEALPEATRNSDPESLPRRKAFLVRAARRLDLIRAMDFIPVISPDQNDGPEYTAWTDTDKQKTAIDAFVQPFPEEPGQGIKPPAFLIVKSMLLTGFDAPVEQVLYLDRSMRDAELLQAVARVNRPAGARKNNGFVMDYVGITRHLTEALKAYSSEDVQGVLRNISDEIGHLGPRCDRIRMLFTSHGVTPASSEDRIEDCVALLEDPQLRDEFETDLQEFASTVDTVLPLPDVDPYLPDLKLFTEIALRARRRYRVDDGAFDPSLYGEKVRELLDEHIVSLGVEQTLPPVSVTSADFRRKVEAMTSHRARASEMKHAIRHHIDVHFGEDPARYRRLSERLEQILAEQKENWEEQASLLSELLEDVEAGAAGGASSDDPPLGEVEYALYGVLLEETATDGVITPDQKQALGATARSLYELAAQRTTRVAFWTKPVDQEDFKRELAAFLAEGAVCPPAQAMKLADRLFDVIKANRRRFHRPGPDT